MTEPQLSVVIPVYGNWWLTARCLRVLDGMRAGPISFETIVVDNASSDETPREIGRFPWVRYVRYETNRNFAGACNAGVKLARAPLAFLLNNDAYPLGDAFSPLVRGFERAEVAIAGSALFFEDGVTQAAGLVLLRNAHWHYSCRNLPASLDGVTSPRDALGVSGAAMAVRTDWFVENGGFDEAFVNGFEDVDLCLRARRQGRAIAYVADSRIAHYEGASAGRFDREAENERRFYERWSSCLSGIPRIGRGQVGAIAVHSSSRNPLLAAARADLEDALRALGHPIAHGAIAPWRRLDRRFRRAADLGWFTDEVAAPGIAIHGDGGTIATIRTHGAITLDVPWLPCAAGGRIARLSLRLSDDPSCRVVGIAGHDAAIDEIEQTLPGYALFRVTPELLLAGGAREVACVVHLGLTDACAFGNVLLAQAGLPAVVLASGEPNALFADDVVLMSGREALAASVERFAGDVTLRRHYGALIAADARRRFSPRRSAIRVVDLLCAARFGLERRAPARSNTPL